MRDADADVVVIGAGLAGSAAARSLARRGAEVVLLEAHDLGHRHGSSHGTSRIFRRAHPQDEYVRLSGEAQRLWGELGEEAGAPLLHRTGGIDHGPGRGLAAIAAALAREAVDHELLSAAEAAARWPGMHFEGDVLFHPDAGVVSADDAVRALVEGARAHGAEVRPQTRVDAVEPLADGVVVRAGGHTLRARRVVVAVGAWVQETLPPAARDRFPEVNVTQQQVFHFVRRDPDQAWPVLIHDAGDEIYALPSGADGGPAPAFKVAEHDRGKVTSAGSRDHVVDPSSRERIVAYVERWLPGLVPEVVAETTCLYTTTQDRDLVLDRAGDVVVASPCSGRGAKFAPVVGELLADLALTDVPTSPRFALRPRRHAA